MPVNLFDSQLGQDALILEQYVEESFAELIIFLSVIAKVILHI